MFIVCSFFVLYNEHLPDIALNLKDPVHHHLRLHKYLLIHQLESCHDHFDSGNWGRDSGVFIALIKIEYLAFFSFCKVLDTVEHWTHDNNVRGIEAGEICFYLWPLEGEFVFEILCLALMFCFIIVQHFQISFQIFLFECSYLLGRFMNYIMNISFIS